MTYLVVGGTKKEREERAKEISPLPFPDVIFLSPFSGETLGIEEVRQLKHRLSLKPFSSPYQAAIITEAQNLTIFAQNALLKILEEPPSSSILILTAPCRESLLPTVVSRCQIIELPSKSEFKISQEEFSSHSLVLASHFKSGLGERMRKAEEIAKSRSDCRQWLSFQIFLFREILLAKLKTQPPLDSLFKFLTLAEIVKIIRRLEMTKRKIEANANYRLALEIFLLDLPSDR